MGKPIAISVLAQGGGPVAGQWASAPGVRAKPWVWLEPGWRQAGGRLEAAEGRHNRHICTGLKKKRRKEKDLRRGAG